MRAFKFSSPIERVFASIGAPRRHDPQALQVWLGHLTFSTLCARRKCHGIAFAISGGTQAEELAVTVTALRQTKAELSLLIEHERTYRRCSANFRC